MMAFKSFFLLPLIAASIVPLCILVIAGVLYVAGGTVTADSLKEGGLLILGVYAIMFFIFLFWQMHAIRRIKKKAGLSLKEIGKLPVEEQKRLFREYGGK